MQPLLQQDDNILRQTAMAILPEEFKSPAIKELAEQMLEVMRDMRAVGVAAPQIGVSKRLIVFGTGYTTTRKVVDQVANTVLINPSLKILSTETQTDYEGCLNCGELRGLVTRAMEIEYTGYDLNGELITKHARGLEARIVQHEVDHLNGTLFIDRVTDKNSFTTLTELLKRI